MSAPEDQLADAVEVTENVVATSRQVRRLLEATMAQLGGVIVVLQAEAHRRGASGQARGEVWDTTRAELDIFHASQIMSDQEIAVTAEERIATDEALVEVATERIVTDEHLAEVARERVVTDVKLAKVAAVLAATVTELTVAVEAVHRQGRWNRAAIIGIIAAIVGATATVVAVTVVRRP